MAGELGSLTVSGGMRFPLRGYFCSQTVDSTVLVSLWQYGKEGMRVRNPLLSGLKQVG